MNVEQFCSASRVVIVAGKGGVGKTTVTAALATTAARAGASVLIVEVEGKSGLAAALGTAPLTYEEQQVEDRLRVRTVAPDEALLEYLEDRGLRRISKRMVRTGVLDVVATAVPGMKDILVLGKVKQLEQADVADLIIIDAPAAGHAITFLLSARGLLDAVRLGPVRSQAEDVIEMISDPTRCRVLLVTLPEETPVNELVETAYALEDRVGVQLAPVIVNGVYPPLAGLDRDPQDVATQEGVTLAPGEADALRAAARFRLQRQELQTEQIGRLAEALPLPQLHLPYLFADRIARPELESLAAALTAQIEGLAVAAT